MTISWWRCDAAATHHPTPSHGARTRAHWLPQSDNGDYELVLRGVLPRADVRVEGGLAFGLLPMDSRATKAFRLVNYGQREAPFRIEYDKWVRGRGVTWWFRLHKE